MARFKKFTESEKLVKQHARGNLETAKHLRDIINPAKINHLILLETEINAIISFIDDPTTETGKSPEYDAALKAQLLSSPEVTLLSGESGRSVAENLKYSTIKTKYINILNKTVRDGDPYQLGHEVGVTTRQLQIMVEGYNPDISKFSTRRKALVKKALKASVAIDNIEKKLYKSIEVDIKKSGLSDKDLLTALTAAGGSIEQTVSMEKNISNKLTETKLVIGLRAEKGTINQFTGNLSNALSRLVRKALTSNKESEIAEVEKLLGITDAWNIRGSPSVADVSMSNLRYAFDKKGNKKPIKSSKSNLRVSRSLPSKNAPIKNLHKRVKQRLALLKTKLNAQKKHKKFIIPTVTLKAIINESLADFIKLRMGKSTATASISYLRNQTGTFSESARILTLNRRETGAYFGVYTYQHEPYEIFEQGQKMGSPGRDPRLYIEGAAREIATQVLKKQFKGLALESK